MTVQSPPRRHPSGRTVTTRNRPPLPRWLRAALWSPLVLVLVLWLGHQLGSAFDGRPAPVPCCWEVTP